ncbi:MAG: hypothetical protein U9O06_10815 [Euryarchaeota archaeon]|nr:hypothetical protein [Euryarchaeota archaeon]
MTETSFETERDRARQLLAADDLTALHVGVIHDDQTVDTVASRRTDADSEAELQTLSLLATHIRAVAAEAGVDYDTVAADAAAIAAQLEELPVEAPADHDSEAIEDGDDSDSANTDDGSDT